MIYTFDSGPLIDLFRHYYRGRFPALWELFDKMTETGCITSTREVFNELVLAGHEDTLAKWCERNKDYVFPEPTAAELSVVVEIFKVPHFRNMVTRKKAMQGKPFADPFVIARAKSLNDKGTPACVITTERPRPNAPNIPNVCAYFGIDCVDLEGFMERENWRF